MAKKIADAFEVTLDYLVGEGQNASFDKKTLKRLEDLEQLEEHKKKTLFDLIDTYIRDAKARKAYA
ncbi:MAG: DNA-binding protein [Bacteroidota bacterium]